MDKFALMIDKNAFISDPLTRASAPGSRWASSAPRLRYRLVLRARHIGSIPSFLSRFAPKGPNHYTTRTQLTPKQITTSPATVINKRNARQNLACSPPDLAVSPPSDLHSI